MKIPIAIFWMLDAGHWVLFYYTVSGLREWRVCHLGTALKALI